MSNGKKMKTKWVGITIVDRSNEEEKSQIFEGRIENKLFADEISKEQFKNNRLKNKKNVKKKKSTFKEHIKCPKCNNNLSSDTEKMKNHFNTCISNVSKKERERIIEVIDEKIFQLDSIEVIKEFRQIVKKLSSSNVTHKYGELTECPKCFIKVKAENLERHLKKCDTKIQNQSADKKINISHPYSENIFEFLDREGVKKVLGNLIQCDYCNSFFEDSRMDKHLKKCSKYKSIKINKTIVEDQTFEKDDLNSVTDDELKHETSVVLDKHIKVLASSMTIDELEDQQLVIKSSTIKELDKEIFWEENSPIKEPTIIDNVLKHQADTFQYRDDEELDPDMIIDEEQYQEEFINNLSNNKVNIVKTERVVFQKNIVDKEEKDLKSDIKIFLSKMYKGYCQVCGFTFKKLNGENSFEMFNWNDKRVVKIKKSFISTADSLCLCRNCSANIKWGAFKPVFIDKVKNIEDFQDKKSDEIKIILHNIVDKEVPNIFKSLLDFNDMYALEIELRKEPRNIYFTNEHLLQFIAYLQTEDEFEEEILSKKEKRKINEISNRIYSNNTWLRREETIPESLAKDFVRNTTWWDHQKAYRYIRANHSHRVKKDYRHGWAIQFGANQFLVGKAIERCKDEINEYIEQFIKGNKMDFNILKEKLREHISGAVATGNNYEYSGYYPINDGYLKFGVQAIKVDDGVNFLIKELGLNEFIKESIT